MASSVLSPFKPVQVASAPKPQKEARLRTLYARLGELKQTRNAVILAHLYERLDVQNIADHVGDSLGLSRQAAQTSADVILFCGVHFMAETAKLLSPDKKVFLGNANAGCPMADMITRQQLIAFKAQHPGVPVVAYVNTSAEVKAESDVCCTSANATGVVQALCQQRGVDRVLFVPDKNLGNYVQSQCPDIELINWDGFCPTHMRMHLEDVEALKKQYPQAMILAHPECNDDIKAVADVIGSTTVIRQTAMASDKRVFIVCTEDGVRARLAQDCPDKLFFTPTQACAVCPNMKLTRLENMIATLEHLPEADEIVIPDAIAEPARQTLALMMAIDS